MAKLTPNQISHISTLLGFSKAEEKVFTETQGIAKSLSTIARQTKISRGSILYIVKKLEKRTLMSSCVGPMGIKGKVWRSNIGELVRKLNAIIQSNN